MPTVYQHPNLPRSLVIDRDGELFLVPSLPDVAASWKQRAPYRGHKQGLQYGGDWQNTRYRQHIAESAQ